MTAPLAPLGVPILEVNDLKKHFPLGGGLFGGGPALQSQAPLQPLQLQAGSVCSQGCRWQPVLWAPAPFPNLAGPGLRMPCGGALRNRLGMQRNIRRSDLCHD